MTLLEIYNKLLARGMPEHPRVVYHHGKRTKSGKCEDGGLPWAIRPGWKFRQGVKADVAVRTDGRSLADVRTIFTETEARAIITMHALEWWQSGRVSEMRFGKSGVPVSILAGGGGDGLFVRGNTILEAIEAATRHLENEPGNHS